MSRILLSNGGPVMIIRPSAAIRQNYNEIADLCKQITEPLSEYMERSRVYDLQILRGV